MKNISLDSSHLREKLDKHAMLAHLRDIPGQCSMGWTRGLGLDIPSDYCDIDSIVVVGMGGSAMGADLARSLIQDQLSIPMVVVRDY